MKIELTLARVGMNMEEATIVKWCRQPGEAFAAGDTLYEIETDKVTFAVEAPAAGVLVEARVPEGDTVPVGHVVGVMEDGSAGGTT